MNTRIQEKLKNLTKELLYANDSEKKHFSFVLGKNGRILSIGQNSEKSHPFNILYNYKGIFKHSEMDAILKLRWFELNFSKVTLVNTRINIFNQFGFCKPCQFCQRFIQDMGIKGIYYMNNYGEFEKL